MILRLDILLLGLILHLGFSTKAQNELPIRWSFALEIIDDRSVYVVASAQIDEGWRLYSPDANSDICIPFDMTFEESADYEPVGELIIKSKELNEYDSDTQKSLLVFRNSAKFKYRIKLNTDSRIIISCYLYGQCCNENLKVCTPVLEEETFYINFDASAR